MKVSTLVFQLITILILFLIFAFAPALILVSLYGMMELRFNLPPINYSEFLGIFWGLTAVSFAYKVFILLFSNMKDSFLNPFRQPGE